MDTTQRLPVEIAGIKGVSLTALYVAAMRALETERPDPLIKDEYAKHFAGEQLVNFIRSANETTFPKEYLYYIFVKRTHILDCLILDGVNKNNIRQIVNLGCGFDSRPYRLNLPNELKFFEIDVPAVLSYKENILNNLNAKPKCQVTTIGMDLLNKDEWANQLLQKNFDKNQPCIFITEGLILYLKEDETKNLLKLISNLSVTGSYVVGDMAGEGNKKNPALMNHPSATKMGITFHLVENILDFIYEVGYDLKKYVFTENSVDKYVAIDKEEANKLIHYVFKSVKK